MTRAYSIGATVSRKVIPAGVRRHMKGLYYRVLRPQTNAPPPLAGWGYYNTSKNQWESEYQSGRWEYMKNLEELARYSIIIGYVDYLKKGSAILDVGCGEGILQEKLGPHSYSRYVGVDVSREAIERAAPKRDQKTLFVCADVYEYAPKEQFDVIIFSEILYYISDPLQFLKRYERYLKPDGIFIISMFVGKVTEFNWQLLDTTYHFMDETTSANKKSGYSWVCKVWSPGYAERSA